MKDVYRDWLRDNYIIEILAPGLSSSEREVLTEAITKTVDEVEDPELAAWVRQALSPLLKEALTAAKDTKQAPTNSTTDPDSR